MTRPATTKVIDQPYELDYKLKRQIAEECGGFIRTGSRDGATAEVWHGDTEYVFKGEGLIEFLFALKDSHVNLLYAALDLCDYIEDSRKQPPSKFVRDAIAARAGELRAAIKREDSSPSSSFHSSHNPKENT